MANSSSFFTFFILSLSALFISSSCVPATRTEKTMEVLSWRSIVAGEDEFGMESEISLRILQANSNYISYDALKRGIVPCSRRGASYYNCKPGAEANPYSRGCSAITRCRH